MTPVIGSDGTIYVGSSDNKLHAVNPDGTPKWTYFNGVKVLSTPAVGSDGTFYFTSDNYKLRAVNPVRFDTGPATSCLVSGLLVNGTKPVSLAGVSDVAIAVGPAATHVECKQVA